MGELDRTARDRKARRLGSTPASSSETPDGRPTDGRPAGEKIAEVQRWAHLVTEAGVPPRYQPAHLSTNCERYATLDGKTSALGRVRKFAVYGRLDQRGTDRFCLLLSGAFGTGKTWLATAALMQMMYPARRGLWRKFYGFVREVQATYAPAAEATSDAVLSRYQRAPVLLLDDVGDLTIGTETEDRRRLLYEVLDYRNDHLLPTILTTNLGGDQLAEQFGERTMQRVLEMCALVGMSGEDLRARPDLVKPEEVQR